MGKALLTLSTLVLTMSLLVGCKKDDQEKDQKGSNTDQEAIIWKPVQESKFVKENFTFQIDGKTVVGLLWVEIEDLEGNVATVEVSIENAKVNGEAIGGNLTWAETIDSGKFVAIDTSWTGAYQESGEKLDSKWFDLVNRIVIKYNGSKHTASTDGLKFSFKEDPVIGTIEVSLR